MTSLANNQHCWDVWWRKLFPEWVHHGSSLVLVLHLTGIEWYPRLFLAKPSFEDLMLCYFPTWTCSELDVHAWQAWHNKNPLLWSFFCIRLCSLVVPKVWVLIGFLLLLSKDTLSFCLGQQGTSYGFVWKCGVPKSNGLASWFLQNGLFFLQTQSRITYVWLVLSPWHIQCVVFPYSDIYL